MKKIITPLVCALILVAVALSCTSCSSMTDNYRIFGSLAECEAMEAAPGVRVVRYGSPAEDTELRGLPYEAFYGAEYTVDDGSFTIFAYEFADADTAAQYYRNVAGKESGRATAFWEQRGMFRARLVVLDGSRVYTVGTSSGDMEAAKSFLAQYFSVSIG